MFMFDRFQGNTQFSPGLAALLSVLLFLAQHSLAQPALDVWTSHGPTGPGYPNKVIASPNNSNVIYAAGDAGVFKSVNNGASWNLGLCCGPYDIAVDPTSSATLYAASYGVIYKSSNGGATWIPKYYSAAGSIGNLTVAPGSPNIIYAVSYDSDVGSTLLFSENAGESWIARPIAVGDYYVAAFAVDPQDPRVIYAYLQSFDDIGLLKTTNGGITWIPFSYEGGVIISTSAFKIDRRNPNIIYAATYYGVYRSTDRGANWTLRGSPGGFATSLEIDPLDPETIYAGVYIQNCCSTGVSKSSNGGISWTPYNVGIETTPTYSLSFDRSGRFLHAATAYGVFSVRVREGVVQVHRTQFDFDGDGRSDISVFRPDGAWYLNRSTEGFSATQFGLSTDKIVPADYDGDGKTDIAVYRDGIWYWLNSSDGNFNAVQYGVADDIPVPADYTGDGRAELAVYRGGTWYSLDLTNNRSNAVQFGLAADRPVVADYDGDGRADPAVYRNGTWYLNRSTQGFAAVQFGLPTDKPVPADYDGDGKTDIAVFRGGTWYVLGSQNGFSGFQFGVSTDIPTPADYDGDGRADAAVFRQGIWHLQQTDSGVSAQQFGQSNDKPVVSAYLR